MTASGSGRGPEGPVPVPLTLQDVEVAETLTLLGGCVGVGVSPVPRVSDATCLQMKRLHLFFADMTPMWVAFEPRVEAVLERMGASSSEPDGTIFFCKNAGLWTRFPVADCEYLVTYHALPMLDFAIADLCAGHHFDPAKTAYLREAVRAQVVYELDDRLSKFLHEARCDLDRSESRSHEGDNRCPAHPAMIRAPR